MSKVKQLKKNKRTRVSKIIIESRMSRSTKIVPKLLNKTFEIHNGNSWHQVLVNNDMIGCKFGEFVNTRKKHIFKKKKKKKKN